MPMWPEEGPRREQGLGGGGGGVGRRSGEAGRAGTGWGPLMGREGPVAGLGSSGGGLEGRGRRGAGAPGGSNAGGW